MRVASTRTTEAPNLRAGTDLAEKLSLGPLVALGRVGKGEYGLELAMIHLNDVDRIQLDFSTHGSHAFR